MNMKQAGTKKKLNLVERGYISTGGSMSETVYKTEAIAFGVGKMLSETLQRIEDVIITNE